MGLFLLLLLLASVVVFQLFFLSVGLVVDENDQTLTVDWSFTDINGVNVTKKLEFKALVMKDPSKADNNNTLVAHWVGGTRSRVELKDKVVHLGGPGEFDAMQMLLATLAACDVDLMALHASFLGLKIESLSVEAAGHFNVQSYLGLEGAPASAYDAISYTVRVSIPSATPEQIAYLRERCERSSPVRDSLMQSIPLKFEFKANS